MTGRLIYSAITSADGYVEDADGDIAWGTPDEELLRFMNELERPARTYLYGRRIWQAAEKIAFSTTLTSVSSSATRIESAFDLGMVRQLKSTAGHEMRVAGADLAGQAIKAGLVDEVRLFLVPILVGGGKRALPDGVRSNLELLDTRRFASGAAYVSYCPEPVP